MVIQVRFIVIFHAHMRHEDVFLFSMTSRYPPENFYPVITIHSHHHLYTCSLFSCLSLDDSQRTLYILGCLFYIVSNGEVSYKFYRAQTFSHSEYAKKRVINTMKSMYFGLVIYCLIGHIGAQTFICNAIPGYDTKPLTR
jgi:hypothetical protein